MTNELSKNFEAIRTFNISKKSEIETATHGDFIMIDLDTSGLYKIEDVYTYQYKKEEPWNEFKLVNVLTGKVKYVEYEIDDVVSIYETTAELKLRNINLKKSDLEELIDEEESIRYNGVEYHYDDDYEVIATSTSGLNEKVYLYEFEADNGDCLTIENWDSSFEVFISKKMKNNIISKVGTGA